MELKVVRITRTMIKEKHRVKQKFSYEKECFGGQTKLSYAF